MPGVNDVQGVIYALGFFHWKRDIVRLCFPGAQVKFVASTFRVPENSWLAVWGMQPGLEQVPAGTRIVRVEDGFLRSVGLGADIILPMSFVMDGRGMYYDATRPSDLEVLLATESFDEALLARARSLRERIVGEGLTKYNVGVVQWRPPETSRRLVLVPGQVESDAALDYSAPGLRLNMDLLQAVRKACPGAYLIYKPHPDVVAGLRVAGDGEQSALQWCDEIVINARMETLLDHVHEVHVLTSLTGFEALLRGKQVTCYGHPFYAGWGLTTDIIPLTRRQRRLTLDELVAGALIRYPLYFDRGGHAIIPVETALDQLLAWRKQHATGMPWWRHITRAFIRLTKSVKNYFRD